MDKLIYCQTHNFPEFAKDCMYDPGSNIENDFQRIGFREDLSDFNKIFNGKTENSCLWKEKIELVEKEAYEKGFTNGISEGIKTSENKIATVINKFRMAISEFEKAKNDLMVLAEKEAVELSLAIARKIVGNEISVNKNTIVHIAKEAIKKVEGHNNIRILLNPSEMDIVNASFLELGYAANCIDKIEFVPDNSVAKGGCIIKTEIAEIDARIEKQLQVIEDAFKLNLKQG